MDKKAVQLEQMYLQMLFDKNTLLLQKEQELENKDQIIKSLQSELSMLREQNNVQSNI